MNTFSFVGSLRAVKDTESFKGFTVTNFDSGWMSERLVFNVIAGDNRHRVEINSGRWKDENKNTIYGFTKGDANKKGEAIQIPWSKRNDPDVINNMAGWKVFTVDTETYKHRKELEEAGETEALEAANKKRKHFLAGTEFCEYVNKVVNSEKCQNMKFRVNGNVTYRYSEKNDQYYASYEVNKIYRVDDDAATSDEMNFDFYFTEDAMDSTDYAETGKATVSGFTQYYDSSIKRNCFCPVTLAMRFGTDEDGMETLAYWNDVFTEFEDDTVRHIGLKCNEINGAQRVQVTYDDLSDKVKRAIKVGAKKLEDALQEAGGTMMGDRIQEIRIVGLGRGVDGSETTAYEVEDLMKKPFKEETKVEDEEEKVDLFADDDEDDYDL